MSVDNRHPNKRAIDATIKGVNAARITKPGRNRQADIGTPIDQASSRAGSNTPGVPHSEPAAPWTTVTRGGGRPDGTNAT